MSGRIRDGAEIRRMRLQILLEIIENHSELSELKIKGLFMLKTGLTSRKIEEYFVDLENVDQIERKDEKVFLLNV